MCTRLWRTARRVILGRMIKHALRAAVAAAALTALVAAVAQQSEAPTGFDDLSNGVVDDSTHHADQDSFDEVETVADGLGPLYNAQSCRECHQNPTSGRASQTAAPRAGPGGRSRGHAVRVPIVEAPGTTRVGRFGWKDQQASLLSFSGDAYLNEMGITSRLFPDEVTTLCNTVAEPNNTPDSTGLED